MTVITRIPPSPTGRMHIGTARTALYNWLFAKANGGKMLFRIEDTDRERFQPEFVESIVNGLTWLGLDWQGEIVSQFEQRARHAEVAKQLVEKGEAYYCYCTPAELDDMREKAKAEGRVTFYDRRWRPEEGKTLPPKPDGVAPVIRIKAPLKSGNIEVMTVVDEVQGNVQVPVEQLDDMILMRSDGTPTYMLAVVVDDHDMGVTHVIRGDDHLNNTFRQNLIYYAMDWPVPVYAHLPLILGPDGSKLSKRHGATSVEEYAKMGYLPEAMRNYLLRLGWSHGDDEFITTEQAIEWFNLEHIGRSAARFDFAKLDNINAHYIKLADNARLLDLCKPIFAERHNITVDAQMANRVLACMDELKTRAKTLNQITDESAFFGKTIPYEFGAKAKETLNTPEAKTILAAMQNKLESLDPFTADSIQTACKQVADEVAGGKLGKIGMPLRAALTGTTVSPSIFHAAEILGRDETLARLGHAVKT